MRCDNCGNEEFFRLNIINGHCPERYVEQIVDAFACEKCGFIKLFAPENFILQHKIQLEMAKKQEQEKIALEKEKKKLETKIESLQKIIADENQTVKAVNQAKEELIKSKNKLSNLTSKFIKLR